MPSTPASCNALASRTIRSDPIPQQIAPLARADAADFLEDRGQVHALSELALELDRKAVCLVADALEQQQRRAARRQHQRILARRQVQLLRLEAAVPFHALRVARAFTLLRDADYVEHGARVAQRRDRDTELPLAAVDHQ